MIFSHLKAADLLECPIIRYLVFCKPARLAGPRPLASKPASAPSRSSRSLHQKAVRVMHAPLAPLGVSDFLWLAFRTLTVVCSIIALAISHESPTGKSLIHSGEKFYESRTLPELSSISPDPVQHAALVAKVLPRLRMLRAVLERLPITFTPYTSEPKYRLTYYRETLECGHVQFAFQGNAFAKRRACVLCAAAALAVAPKKPSLSVADSNAQQEKQA
jgi:hypothetical protein